MNMTPKEIVNYLDDYVIGQNDAKKTIALALRNRYRRMQLSDELQEEIMPKNILMIGSTGVGKTEIARRLAKMMNLPFVKVEASKYTEVGYVGRDVESMIRDLVFESINIVTKEFKESTKDDIDNEVLKQIMNILVPSLPDSATDASRESFIKTYNVMEKKLLDGSMDDKKITIEIPKKIHVEVIDLSGRLRFQKRWAQTPRIPETSVLGHMLTVAIFGYFYSIEIGTCDKRLENNFFTALFHDLPEALTRDIISPVKYSVDELADIISEYEITKIEDDILPNVPHTIKKEFSYLLGLYDGVKDEFLDKIIDNGTIKVVDNVHKYDEDKYEAIDGLALKQCDKLSAFIEASLSISHGIKSNELVNGKKQILNGLKTINGVDFKAIAKEIDLAFGTTGQTQSSFDFD